MKGNNKKRQTQQTIRVCIWQKKYIYVYTKEKRRRAFPLYRVRNTSSLKGVLVSLFLAPSLQKTPKHRSFPVHPFMGMAWDPYEEDAYHIDEHLPQGAQKKERGATEGGWGSCSSSVEGSGVPPYTPRETQTSSPHRTSQSSTSRGTPTEKQHRDASCTSAGVSTQSSTTLSRSGSFYFSSSSSSQGSHYRPHSSDSLGSRTPHSTYTRRDVKDVDGVEWKDRRSACSLRKPATSGHRGVYSSSGYNEADAHEEKKKWRRNSARTTNTTSTTRNQQDQLFLLSLFHQAFGKYESSEEEVGHRSHGARSPPILPLERWRRDSVGEVPLTPQQQKSWAACCPCREVSWMHSTREGRFPLERRYHSHRHVREERKDRPPSCKHSRVSVQCSPSPLYRSEGRTSQTRNTCPHPHPPRRTRYDSRPRPEDCRYCLRSGGAGPRSGHADPRSLSPGTATMMAPHRETPRRRPPDERRWLPKGYQVSCRHPSSPISCTPPRHTTLRNRALYDNAPPQPSQREWKTAVEGATERAAGGAAHPCSETLAATPSSANAVRTPPPPPLLSEEKCGVHSTPYTGNAFSEETEYFHPLGTSSNDKKKRKQRYASTSSSSSSSLYRHCTNCETHRRLTMAACAALYKGKQIGMGKGGKSSGNDERRPSGDGREWRTRPTALFWDEMDTLTENTSRRNRGPCSRSIYHTTTTCEEGGAVLKKEQQTSDSARKVAARQKREEERIIARYHAAQQARKAKKVVVARPEWRACTPLPLSEPPPLEAEAGMTEERREKLGQRPTEQGTDVLDPLPSQAVHPLRPPSSCERPREQTVPPTPLPTEVPHPSQTSKIERSFMLATGSAPALGASPYEEVPLVHHGDAPQVNEQLFSRRQYGKSGTPRSSTVRPFARSHLSLSSLIPRSNAPTNERYGRVRRAFPSPALPPRSATSATLAVRRVPKQEETRCRPSSDGTCGGIETDHPILAGGDGEGREGEREEQPCATTAILDASRHSSHHPCGDAPHGDPRREADAVVAVGTTNPLSSTVVPPSISFPSTRTAKADRSLHPFPLMLEHLVEKGIPAGVPSGWSRPSGRQHWHGAVLSPKPSPSPPCSTTGNGVGRTAETARVQRETKEEQKNEGRGERRAPRQVESSARRIRYPSNVSSHIRKVLHWNS